MSFLLDAVPGQIRMAEHTDFGCLTLVFQDSSGGLEVSSCRVFINHSYVYTFYTLLNSLSQYYIYIKLVNIYMYIFPFWIATFSFK